MHDGGIEPGERLSIPTKHMSGRLFAPDGEPDRSSDRQVVLRYTAPRIRTGR